MSYHKTKIVGQNVISLPQTDSTQNIAKTYANQGKPEGTLVIAETQTAGKGRMGREWVSNKGGIWASLILRPTIPPQQVPLIPLVVSLAIAKAIEKTCKLKCSVKWPNDILVQKFKSSKVQKFKKVCGILTEMSAEADRVNWVVLGFGINVNNTLPELLKEQACSLKEIKGKPVNRINLLQTVLREIESVYFRFLKNGFAGLKAQYLKQCLFKKGTKVDITNLGQKKSGKFFGMGEDGSLILRMDHNRRESFLAGDATLSAN